ncbi:NB-ARC domain, LRR domain containing protein [Parasponia andersonii]|uniref:NB-ARC domain, LRR domain containing protein n=1 Tax=Parasponia andersonii TaxID=3476 RepID=A0A2P5BEZ3_PARAD|nr:NB-ARC domain, LRR domain containing protein [Parasponia andersonii]
MEVLGAVSAAFPMVIFLANGVLGHLKVLNRGGKSSVKANETVEELKKRFSTFQASIKEEEKRRGGSSSNTNGSTYLSEDFVKQIRDLAFEIEDALDEFLFHVPHHSHNSRTRQYQNAVNGLSSQRKKIVQNMETLLGPKLHKDRLKGDISGTIGEAEYLKTDQMLEDDEIVGYKKLRKDLVNQLIKGDGDQDHSKRATIQVVGPGGSGKTFLVKNVYQKRKVEECFDCRAWIRVTQSFKLEELLLDILKQFCSARDEQILRELVGNTQQKLQRYLQSRKYLLVLDDVWNRQSYTPIANSLPNNSRSRIIITTRRYDVVDKSNYTHKIDGMSKEEAWDLFSRHAFHGTTSEGKLCPEDLKESAEKIIEKCDLFPLHVAVVGNLLSKKLQCKIYWENCCKSLGSDIRHSSLPVINLVLQPSFMDLPDYLKNCFLYFGVFPEGYSIRRRRLIRSWLAEGFVEERTGKTLEEVAEAYLNELIERNLVQVSESTVDGKVRSCKVIRLYHDFIIWLSRKANFVTVINQMNTTTIVQGGERVRRLSFHNVSPQFSDIPESAKRCVRAFFIFGQQEVSRKKSALQHFGLLKVLDLQGVPAVHNFGLEEHVGRFLLLRCLNLRQTNIEKLPSIIKNLTLLETVDLRNTLVKKLPKWIYQLTKLRHLLVSCVDSEDDASSTSNSCDGCDAKGVKVYHGNIGVWSSLQKLSLMKVINDKKFIKDLGRLSQLVKLGLADLKSEFGTDLCKSIEKMKNLSTFDVRAMENEYLDLDEMENPPNHVQRLYLSGRLILNRLPRWLSSRSLLSLVKVVLKRSKLDASQNPFEGLETLPSLMELKMVDYYTGKRLVFKAKTFKNLKKLHIEQFDQLTEMTVENEAMTSLEKLTIWKCKNLNPFPCSYSLGHLEELNVDEMKDEFISNVKRRRELGELHGQILIEGN